MISQPKMDISPSAITPELNEYFLPIIEQFCGVKHGLLHLVAFLYKIIDIFSIFWGILNTNMTSYDKLTVLRDDIRFLSDQMWPKWVKTAFSWMNMV